MLQSIKNRHNAMVIFVLVGITLVMASASSRCAAQQQGFVPPELKRVPTRISSQVDPVTNNSSQADAWTANRQSSNSSVQIVSDSRPASLVNPAVQPAAWNVPTAPQAKELLATHAVRTSGTAASQPSLALRSPSKASAGSVTESGVTQGQSAWSSLISIFAALLLVVGLFLGLVWVMRRTSLHPYASVPSSVVQVLGRSPLAPRQQLYLVRFGPKLVLVSHQMGQTETLSEIDDPLEVDRLCGLCESQSSHSVSQSFRSVFQQVTAGNFQADRDGKKRRPSNSRSPFDSAG